jgi:hypothetical protein
MTNSQDAEWAERAASSYNLALLYTRAKRFSDAETECKKALDLIEEASGPDDPNLVRYLELCAEILRIQKNSGDAEKLESRARAIRGSHPDLPSKKE